MESFDKVTQN